MPGCGCPDCTGIPADHPVRVAAHQRIRAQLAKARALHRAGAGHHQEQQWEDTKARARAIAIVAVAERLGLGPIEGRGKQVRGRCPFHDDAHPSLSLNTEKNLWYCPVCATGGDGVKLYMRARQVPFATAVRDLTC